MKKILFAICMIACVYFITGCSKDATMIQPQPAATSSISDLSDTTGYYLNLTDWSTVPNSGVYTYNFGTLRPPRNATSPYQVDVFVLNNSVKIPVTRPVKYMNGDIWTVVNGLNVTLAYRVEDGGNDLPFYSLNVQIVIH